MKNFVLLALCSFLSIGVSAFGDDDVRAGVVVIEGTYQNRNLYVMNNIHSSGVGFCTYEVRVNGEITTDEWNSSAFEIDLSHLQLKQGEEVFVQIMYKDDCPPKVLNPGVVKPRPTFQTKEIKLDKEGLLQWSTTNEHGELPFLIQMYKWNKWITLGEVLGKGTETTNAYEYKLDLVSGDNAVRVIQKGLDRNVVVSPTARVRSLTPPIELSYDKKADKIVFTSPTAYEVYDQFGQITKRGFASSIDASNMDRKNTYYISYDNKTDDFTKKDY